LNELDTEKQSIATNIASMRLMTPVNGAAYEVLGHTSIGIGGGVFYGVAGAAAGTYTDNNGTIIVPTGGDGSAAFLREDIGYVTPQMFGAVGDGITDDTTAINAARAYSASNKLELHIASGLYLHSAVVYTVTSLCKLLNDSFASVLSINPVAKAENNIILLTTETDASTTMSSRLSKIAVSVNNVANGAQHSTGVRANLYNHSTNGNGCTGFYGAAYSDTMAFWSAAIHGETRHAGGTTIGINSETATFSANGSVYGSVIQIVPAGGGTHPITGAALAAHPNATGLHINGSKATYGDKASWAKGIALSNQSIRATGTAISVESSSSVGIGITGVNTSDISLTGNSIVGISLSGAYTSGIALRVAANQKIGLELTNNISLGYDSTLTEIALYNGATRNVSFPTGTPSMKINGTQVVSSRQTGWSTPTGTAQKGAFSTATVTLAALAENVKGIIDALKVHGLIGV